MERHAIEEIEHVDHPAHVNTIRKPVSHALGLTNVGLVYNELAPGDAFSGALHTHHDQEEIFYILEGKATFEVGKNRTLIEVSEGEVIRFAPGEFQRGFNATDDWVVGLIVSAPGAEHDWAKEELLIECRGCREETIHRIEPVESGSWQAASIDLRMKCSECGKAYTTADFPG